MGDRRGSVFGCLFEATSDRRRFALQGYFLSEKPLYKNLHAYYEKSFGVHLLGFIRDHENYNCLEPIIKTWANKIVVSKPPLAVDHDFMDEVLNGE